MTLINDSGNMRFEYQKPNKPFVVPDVDVRDPIVIEVNDSLSFIHVRHWYEHKEAGDHRRTKKGAMIPIPEMMPFLVALVRLYNQTVPRDMCLGLAEIELLQDLEDHFPHEDLDEATDWWDEWTPFGGEHNET